MPSQDGVSESLKTFAVIERETLSSRFQECEDFWTSSHRMSSMEMASLRLDTIRGLASKMLNPNDMNELVIEYVALRKMWEQLPTLGSIGQLKGSLAKSLVNSSAIGTWTQRAGRTHIYDGDPTTYEDCLISYSILYIASVQTRPQMIAKPEDTLIAELLAKSLTHISDAILADSKPCLMKEQHLTEEEAIARIAQSNEYYKTTLSLSQLLVDVLQNPQEILSLTKDFRGEGGVV